MYDFKGVRDGRTVDSRSTASGAYSVKFAYVITLALSFLLWWVPGLGQAAAGYVGGRKAGSSGRALLSGTLAVGSIIVMSMAFSFLSGYLPEAVGTGFVADYFTSFVNSVDGVSSIALNPYALLLVFSMIGGMLAGQARKEADLIARTSAEANRRRYRSVELHAQGKKPGFESYENCLKISVNTMHPVNHPRQSDARDSKETAAIMAEEAPAPELKPEPKPPRQSPVTSTLDMSSTPSTATSADDDNPFAAILRKSDRKSEPTDGQDQEDDFEYI